MKMKAEQEVEDAVAFAESGTYEPVEQLSRFTYSENNPDTIPHGND